MGVTIRAYTRVTWLPEHAQADPQWCQDEDHDRTYAFLAHTATALHPSQG